MCNAHIFRRGERTRAAAKDLERRKAIFIFHFSLWLHDMGTLYTLLVPCKGNPLLTVGSKFLVSLNDLLNKQSRYQLFETPWRSFNIMVMVCCVCLGLFTMRPAWISNHVPSNMCHEIIYTLLNFNGCTIEVWEWMDNLCCTLWWM